MTSEAHKTAISQAIWNDHYKSCEQGYVGMLYPNEPLIKIISTIRQGVNLDKSSYFDVQGRENSQRSQFIGKSLEIGFGHVSNILMMEEKGFDCYGLEVSHEAVLRGQERLDNKSSNAQLTHWTDLSNIPYEDQQFDFIYGLQCLYYNVDIHNIIAEVNRCLKPGGHFAFSFFSTSHDYIKYIDIVAEHPDYKVVKWSDSHPSFRIRGAYLAQPDSADALTSLFKLFPTSRVFTEESNFSPLFESWWYIYGEK